LLLIIHLCMIKAISVSLLPFGVLGNLSGLKYFFAKGTSH
jgi:hypothetical protein